MNFGLIKQGLISKLWKEVKRREKMWWRGKFRGGVWRKRESGACVPLPTESTFVFIRWQSRGISTGAVGKGEHFHFWRDFARRLADFHDFADREKRMLTGALKFSGSERSENFRKLRIKTDFYELKPYKLRVISSGRMLIFPLKVILNLIIWLG